ncbi:ankyrin repeat domain-containing protein [Sporosarcina sp. ACRSM]|uniref:ankyrin repeat domain-containing protein n=1 Tax=Sporosarcina sp. ACRSM TaxID=2918216 RepID=UPI001EF4E416|nr:ankyrin repeat domain-containing protein [Sporosarcina sp. ACRSM]MCG7334809.1 ankyrin repeat domain-containing protein [Sporosarcina sp. ACRSM]
MKKELREPLDYELVKAFIIAAHGNLEEVKKLLAIEPALLHAVINWGGDDWESGIGAAAHTGNRAIAEWLLEQGARMDIFAAAMLGELELVRAMVTLQPTVVNAKGPHGIPLIRHAQMGGELSRPVYEFLETFIQKEEVVG